MAGKVAMFAEGQAQHHPKGIEGAVKLSRGWFSAPGVSRILAGIYYNSRILPTIYYEIVFIFLTTLH